MTYLISAALQLSIKSQFINPVLLPTLNLHLVDCMRDQAGLMGLCQPACLLSTIFLLPFAVSISMAYGLSTNKFRTPVKYAGLNRLFLVRLSL